MTKLLTLLIAAASLAAVLAVTAAYPGRPDFSNLRDTPPVEIAAR